MLVNSSFNSCYMYSSRTMASYADHSLIFGTHALERTSVILGAPCKSSPVRTQNNLLFQLNDFIPLTINIQPDLTYNSLVSCFFLLPFLPLFYNTFAALFVEHLFGSVLSNYPKGYYGLTDQALQKTCYLCSRPLRDLFFMLPFFLNHTITSETVPRRKFSVSAKYYNVHACPLFFIDLIMFHVWVQFFTYFCYLYNCM